MMTQTVLTKTARTGQAIRIDIQECLPGQCRALAYVDGRCLGQGNVRLLDRPQDNVTHCIASPSGRIGVGLTSAEAQTVRAAIEQAHNEYAATAAGRMAALRRERSALLLAIDGADAQARFDFERLHAQQDERCWQAKAEGDTKVQAMLDGLRRWDEAHPELLAQLRTEQDEATRRFVAGN